VSLAGQRGDSVARQACAVAIHGRALLITGASGTGKSALALQLMALGAGLIADDRVELFLAKGTPHARAPASLPALIEARGIGLLRVTLHPPAPVIVIVDLDATPPARLPRPLHCDILGQRLPLLAGQIGPHLAPALIQILTTGHVPYHD